MKLTAQDLQIGDLVKHGFGFIGKVTELCNGIVTVYDKRLDDGEGNCEVNFAENEIAPIPITPEILEKNFKKDDGWINGYFLNDDVHIYKENEEEGTWNIEYMELPQIKYVHQLQQAMRLCGIKGKEIEL